MAGHADGFVPAERVGDIAAAYGVLAMVATDRPEGAAEIINRQTDPAQFALLIAQAAVEMAYGLLPARGLADRSQPMYVPDDPRLDAITSMCRASGRQAADCKDMPEYTSYPARFFPQLVPGAQSG